uniref:Alpha-mannosidase n=1 Tax=Dolopus genitalis TaxID=2488630 RepID=A0A3G5BIG9_DOLGE|nr:venom polypeptide [Dolopus genitalis]
MGAYVKFMFFLGVVSLHSVYAKPTPANQIWNNRKVCGYKSCPPGKPEMLNVHIVPHTHDDVGWLKTVDQYYYGSKTLIQKAGVQYILDSVIQELLKDPNKKFIYVESAFFFKWWKEQSEKLQEQVKGLVEEGRLEFIGGAWSMNDEATTHYQSIIDQFTWGLRRLNDTFGKCGRPRIGWQIDPFGHSREMASIFAQMGYDGLFFGRLDYQDKDKRLRTKTSEMIWRASANLGKTSDLFTGALYNQYQPPPGFCFDILCADEPIIDGKHSPDNNVHKRVSEFLTFINRQRKYYKTNNIILTMGGDFTFMDANVYYKNLDKLIRYTNEKQANGSDVNLFYSTPSCYLKALHDAEATWPIKDDDFFPYASDPHAYWTGYFTSRPTLKRFERIGNHFLQVCKQLSALSPKKEKQLEPHLTFLRETMGIMQHHDAVTGTEKEQVAYDYAKRVDVGIRACRSNARAVLNRIVTGKIIEEYFSHSAKTNYNFEFANCLLRNISVCEVSENNDNFTVTLYNPIAHSVFEYIRIPVPSKNYVVLDYRGIQVPSQIVPIPSPIKELDFRSSNSSYELVFLASELPPMGYKSYYISTLAHNDLVPEVMMVMDTPVNVDGITIGNKYINLTFDERGLLFKVSSNGITREIVQDFLYYEAAVGNNAEFENRSSGAYIFRPNNTVNFISTKIKIEVFRGPLVEEVHQIFNNWVSQVIRVYKDESFAEFEWLVGPIPVDDEIGKEVITKFKSNIKSDGIFFTDSNGREMIKRKLNHRDTWNVDLKEKVAGNYYPLTTKIALQDEEARLAILVDRAQGGSSLEDGSLEIMVHRRLLHDDAFGVDEALNEKAYGKGLIARGHHYLLFGPTRSKSSPTTQAKERFIQLQKFLPSWVFLSDASKYSFYEWKENYNNIFSGLSLSLPQNINFMTLEPWHENKLLVRFEHILEKEEDPEYSKPVQFNLKDVMRDFPITQIEEMTLDGNLLLKESTRLDFKPDPVGIRYSLIEENNVENIIKIQNPSKPLISARYYDVENYLENTTNVTENKYFSQERSHVIMQDQLKVEETNNVDDNPFIIIIKPMQIRTFVVSLEPGI